VADWAARWEPEAQHLAAHCSVVDWAVHLAAQCSAARYWLAGWAARLVPLCWAVLMAADRCARDSVEEYLADRHLLYDSAAYC
jgi:hypothetical protein